MRGVLASLFVRGGHRPSRARTIVFALLFAYVGTALMLLFGVLFQPMIDAFSGMGLTWLYFALYASMVFALGVVGTVFIASAQIFGPRDNELLLALPIRPGHILISRILVLLTVEAVVTLLVLVPVTVIWLRAGLGSVAGMLMLVAGTALLPLLALSVSLLLAWLLSVVGQRVRFKNLVTLVVSVAFLIGYLYIYSNIQRYLNDLIARGEEFASAFSRAMPPFYSFGVAVAEGNPAQFAVFALWAVLPFGLVFLLLSSRYLRILTTRRGSRRVRYQARELRRSGRLLALTRKELAYFWSRPAVVLNSSIGSVFLLLGAVLLLVNRDNVLGSVETFMAVVPGATFPGIAVAAVAAVGSANNLSSSLVSLEGRSLWIARSLPVGPMTVIQAKINAHLTVSALPALIASVLLGAAVAEGPKDWAAIVLIPQTFLVMLAFAGAAVNLVLPRLDWISEVQVVKQSASAMAALFGGMGIVAGLALLYAFLVRDLMALDAYLWLCGAVFVAATIAVYAFLRRGGVERFEGLAA